MVLVFFGLTDVMARNVSWEVVILLTASVLAASICGLTVHSKVGKSGKLAEICL